jgi:hypothetical protein
MTLRPSALRSLGLFEDANNVLAHDRCRKPVTAFRNHADEESSKTRAQKRRGNKNYCRNKIVAILFSKVQCSRGKRVRDFKTSLFCTHTLVSHQKVDRTRLRPDRRRSL